MKMKKLITVIFSVFLLVSFVAAQPKPVNQWNWVNQGEGKKATPTIADKKLMGISMVTVTAEPATFILGEHSQSFTAKVTLMPYEMNQFETTYQLWDTIRKQAEEMGYKFANPGQEGSMGRRGKAPTSDRKFEPVVTVDWRDVIVWCNALSEIQKLKPCYTYKGKVLRDSTDASKVDLAKCDWRASGYRLPTEAEWEYAARYTKDGIGRGDDYAGSTEQRKIGINMEEDPDKLWCNVNSKKTKEVATSGDPNDLGLFDLTGNVMEWCWDWYAYYSDSSTYTPNMINGGPEFGEYRIARGGGWSLYTPFLFAGDRYGFEPSEAYNYMGFRLCRTLPM